MLGSHLDLLVILLLPCVVEILQLSVYRTGPFYTLPQITGGVDIGAGQLITLVLGVGSCSLGQPASSSLSSPPGELSNIAPLPQLVHLLHQ